MKKNIFIALSIIIASGIIFFGPLKSIKTPVALSSAFTELVTNNRISRFIVAKLPNAKQINSAGEQALGPIVKQTRASTDKVTFIYKGKRLTIFTNDLSQEVPEYVKELVYQAELKKAQENLKK